jgi:phosphoglycerate dehydrogenase-like enzyme
MIKLAILDDYQNVALQMADWSVLNDDVEIIIFDDHAVEIDRVAERLQGCEIVCIMRERTPFPRALIEKLPDLKLLVTSGMRNAAVDLAAARDCGITVSGTEGSSHATAELAWGLILALLRHIPLEHQSMREGGWQETLGHDLRGKTLGLLGLGRLGAQVAAVGNAFGMEVLAWSQNLTEERAGECGATRVEMADLLGRADIVSIHLVLSERTRGLLGREEFEQMKSSAALINTSRGPIVNEAALIYALEHGQIHAAGIDVYDVEPLPYDHPLRALDNVILTPHVGYVTEETYRAFYRGMVEDVQAYLAGAPIRVIAPSEK